MKSKSSNNFLIESKKNKKNEFYTKLSDIEKELIHYKEHFKDKVVYCNCDDPRESNFFRYFFDNFENLGLKNLITTCYKKQNINIFSQNTPERGIYLEYNGDKNNNVFDKIKYLKGDGDFRSKECIDILKQADIVVTNPPFSLFRQYVAKLIEYDKKFLIMGHVNAVKYKRIFDLLKENKIWLGKSIYSGSIEFRVPYYYNLSNASYTRLDENGNKYIKIGGIRWFTNLDYKKHHKELILTKTYKGNEKDYPKYDNYDAIEVSKVSDIPMDYEGAMGVPITFFDKYNPDQFEILSTANPVLNGKNIYARILIKNKKICNYTNTKEKQ